MTYFANVQNGIVTDVIRITQDEVNTGIWGNPTQWIETSYNTRGGIYYIPDTDTPDPDQTKALRANYAGIGYVFDAANNVFYAPKPAGDGWTISAPTWLWVNSNPQPVSGSDSVNTNYSDVIALGTSEGTVSL
jgi:hypothetical protein